VRALVFGQLGGGRGGKLDDPHLGQYNKKAIPMQTKSQGIANCRDGQVSATWPRRALMTDASRKTARRCSWFHLLKKNDNSRERWNIVLSICDNVLYHIMEIPSN
jgi:hypothetical protein